MKKSIIFVAVATIVIAMAFSGISCKATIEEPAEEVVSAEEATEETAEEAAPAAEEKPYAGTVLNYLGPDEPMNIIIQERIGEFEELTGIKVELELLGVGDSMTKTTLEASKGSPDYDILNFPTYDNSVYYYNGWVANLDELEASSGKSFNRDTFVPGLFEAVSQLDGVTYGIPNLFASQGPIQYRKDLFEDPDEMEAFKTEYGYPLAPPKNWDEFYDIAEFFTRDTDNDGENDFWGCNLLLSADGPLWDHWLIRYLGSEQEADASTLYAYIFTEKLEQRFTDIGVRIINDTKKILDAGIAMPGALSMSWDQATEPMQLGQVAMTYAWAEELSPSFTEAYNPEYYDKIAWAPMCIYEVPRMEVGAWLLAINQASENKEAAYEFIVWATSLEYEVANLGSELGFTMPTRAELFKDMATYEGNEHYLTVKDMLAEYEQIPELFLPEVAIVQTEIMDYTQLALIGEMSPKEAMEAAADEIAQGFEDAGAFDRVE